MRGERERPRTRRGEESARGIFSARAHPLFLGDLDEDLGGALLQIYELGLARADALCHPIEPLVPFVGTRLIVFGVLGLVIVERLVLALFLRRKEAALRREHAVVLVLLVADAAA